MALHKNFPKSPYAILDPKTRWVPADETYRTSDVQEYVSVVGTDAFMDFVESIKGEGVELEEREMGEGTEPKAPLYQTHRHL